MATRRKSDRLSSWMEQIDGLTVDDDALRIFAKLLRVYLERGPEDREGIASMASIIADPEIDPDDAQAALDTLRESLHSSAESIDLASDVDLDDAEREVARRMDEQEATFADRLAEIMTGRSMSQVQLAQASGVGQPAISMMLARSCRPQRRTVERLSLALGVAPDELWPPLALAVKAETASRDPNGRH